MKRLFIFISIMLGICRISSAQTDIPLESNSIGVIPSGGRTILKVPTATLDVVELTLLFPLATESQVILIDQDTQSVAYSQSFPSTRDLTIDLAEEDLDDGTYTLRVYAFGKWWIGEFELEDSSME